MTDPASHLAVTIDVAAAQGVHALELWDREASGRLAAVLGLTLPPPGRSAGDASLTAMRVEPAVWLLDGPALVPDAIEAALGDGGALTAIGGGLVRVRLSGPGWRGLLMADGMFDAEDPAFGPGSVVATIIAHVAVRLHVVDAQTCDAYVPASYATGLIHGWAQLRAR